MESKRRQSSSMLFRQYAVRFRRPKSLMFLTTILCTNVPGELKKKLSSIQSIAETSKATKLATARQLKLENPSNASIYRTNDPKNQFWFSLSKDRYCLRDFFLRKFDFLTLNFHGMIHIYTFECWLHPETNTWRFFGSFVQNKLERSESSRWHQYRVTL